MEKELKTGWTVRQQCRAKGPTPVKKKRNEGRSEIRKGRREGRKERGRKDLRLQYNAKKVWATSGESSSQSHLMEESPISQEWTCPGIVVMLSHWLGGGGWISEHSILQEIWEMHFQATTAALKPFRSNGLDKQNLEMSYLSDEKVHRWRPFINYWIHSQYPNYHLVSSIKEFSVPSPCLYICDLIAQVLWNSPFSESPLAHECTMYQILWLEKYGYCI